MANATVAASHVEETSAPVGSRLSNYYLEIFLVSFAGLLLEISYTRITSYKLFYYFTYLVLGLALLGLGAGGVIVAVSERLRRASTDVILMWCLLLGAAAMSVGYLIVAFTPIDTLAVWNYGWHTVTNGALLLLLCLVLFVSFVPAGIILSTLFGRRPEGIGRLYFADLAGAALACALAVYLMASIGPPAAVMLASLALAVPGVRIARRLRSRAFPFAVVLSAVLALCVAVPSLLPDVKLDQGKVSPFSSQKLLYSSWSPLFRVDVRDGPSFRALYHDGLLGSVMLPWSGKTADLAKFNFKNQRDVLPFSVDRQPPGRELIIGAAAGHEVVSSLYFDSGHIDAVELNPVTFNLVTKKMADYNGHLAQNPRVHYVNADGRSYLARSHNKYNLIWYPAPDSYSATNASSASAFVLSESYLYTSDAIKVSLKHLAPGGLLVNQFGDNDFNNFPTRTARYVESVRTALGQLGVDHPENNIMVSSTPDSPFPNLSTIVVKMTPFTAAEIARFTDTMPNLKGSRVAYAPGKANPAESITRFVVPDGAGKAAASKPYKYSVGSISDNKPFFWHYSSFQHTLSNFRTPITPTNTEAALGERVLLLLLAFATLLSVVFLLLPFFLIRKTWRQLPRKGFSALYFMAIGLGFIFFEIAMIQKMVLFLGFPTYSLTVTLSSLLIFVGIGALLSGKLTPTGRSIFLLPVPVAVLAAFYLFFVTPLTDSLLHYPLGARVVIAFVLMAPLGLWLGMFMPFGVRAISELTEHSREYVAWGWALNGFASVIGSVLATMLAMTYGFEVVIVTALCAYVIAALSLRALSRGSGIAAAA